MLGASLVTESGPPGAVRVEFQSAPRGRDGRPDASLAGDWTSDLALVPPRRFVRFRVRWTERDAESPRVDRVVMPFDPASR